MGGLRAVLGQWAGGGLPLPQAKAPHTVGRRVILFGLEPCQWGFGTFALRGGVGRGNWWLHCWACTLHRKIRVQFQERKHTSLVTSIVEYRAFVHLGLENELRNVCRNAWETVVL